MELLECLKTRRSIRACMDHPGTREPLRDIIHAGTMARSGLNNQPWRFTTIQNKEIRQKPAGRAKYSHIAGKASCPVHRLVL